MLKKTQSQTQDDVVMKNEEKPRKSVTTEFCISEQLKKELGYDADLIIDEEDERALSKMPQIQKMRIMEERR